MQGTIMEAILSEFNSSVEWIKKQMEVYNVNHSETKRLMLKLLDHNRKLLAELKHNTLALSRDGSEDRSMQNLEQQLKEAVESKNSAMELWRNAVKELGLEQQSTSYVDQHIAAVSDHYARGLQILSSELSETRSEVSAAKEEVKKLNGDIEQLKLSLKQAEETLKEKEAVSDCLNAEKESLTKQLIIMKMKMDKYDAVCKENANLKSENAELTTLNKTLSEKISSLNHGQTLCEKAVKESLLTAEEAVLQKKEVCYKEQVALKLIQNLRSSIDKEVKLATEMYKAQINDIQKQNAEKVESLVQEIKALQLENSERHTALERALRQMHAAEAKLESLSNENAEFISPSVFSDLCHRLTLAEKARDEAVFKVCSLESAIKNIEHSNKRELEFFRSETKLWKERFHKLQNDLSGTADEKMHLADLIRCLRKKCVSLERELEVFKTQHEKELSLLSQSVHRKEEVFTQQVQLVEEHYIKLISEQCKLLDAQSRTSKKWKDTVYELSTVSELKMKEMYKDIVNLHNRNQELAKEVEVYQRNSIQKQTPFSVV